MKKIFYLLVITAFVFTSCDPMEEIDKDLNNQESVVVGETIFTLSDDDYSDLELNYGSFSSVDDAKMMIPGLLIDKFPVWGKSSLATVTFNLYKSNKIRNVLDAYEVTAADYSELGYNYGNFSSTSDLNSFMGWKYPDATRGDLIELSYRYYIGGGVTEDKISKLLLLDEWKVITEFSNEDYNAMGHTYPNFGNKDEAKHKIAIYLKTLLPYAYDGDNITSLFNYRHKVDGVYQVDEIIAPFTYDGSVWNYISSVIEETVKFGHNGISWEPDNTIVYTLTNADYTLVGNGQYFNFDVRAGKDDETEEARIVKINTILLNNFPSTEEGQKYLVKYAVYTGAAEIWQTKMIFDGVEFKKFEE